MQIACRQSDCTWNCVPTRKQDYLLQLEQSLTCVCVLSCTCCEADLRFEPEAIMYLDMYGCKRCLCNLCQSSTCTFAWRIHTHGCMAWAGIPIYPTLGGFCASSDRCQKGVICSLSYCLADIAHLWYEMLLLQGQGQGSWTDLALGVHVAFSLINAKKHNLFPFLLHNNNSNIFLVITAVISCLHCTSLTWDAGGAGTRPGAVQCEMQLSGDLQWDHHRSAEAEQWESKSEGGHEEGLLCRQPHRADCAQWYAHLRELVSEWVSEWFIIFVYLWFGLCRVVYLWCGNFIVDNLLFEDTQMHSKLWLYHIYSCLRFETTPQSYPMIDASTTFVKKSFWKHWKRRMTLWVNHACL